MNNKTVVISCAGMGNRLGKGIPKALIDIDGKPLIAHQLEMLKDVDDVRVVVGYQAEKVIETVEKYRKNVTFAYNYDYKTTGTGASFSKGCVNAKKYVIALDGDLLVHPDDMKTILEYDNEFIGGTTPTTDDPILVKLDSHDNVIAFSREHGELEWTGLTQVETSRLTFGTGHVYQMLEPILPIKVIRIRTREVDTVNDYERAVDWVKNNYED